MVPDPVIGSYLAASPERARGIWGGEGDGGVGLAGLVGRKRCTGRSGFCPTQPNRTQSLP